MFTGPFCRTVRRWLRLEASAEAAAHSHFLRGNSLSDAGSSAEAVTAYQSAIALKPDYAEAYYRLGLTWRDLQKFGDALASYRQALAIRPDYAEVHNNIGAVLQLQGKLDEALASYRRSVELKPGLSQPYFNLGRLCEALGDRAQAIRCFQSAIEGGVEPEVFRHLLDAAAGVNTDRAPPDYARSVFDDFAPHFDRRLVDELGYRIPQLLVERVHALVQRSGLRVLDLGCGTGLCGLYIKDQCNLLVGVDLSPAMLAKARARDVYHVLVEQDLAAYLGTAPAANFDVVLAADVFLYIGALREIFAEIARTLKTGGVFAFSIELAAAGQDFVLQPNEHYSQSVPYIQRIAQLAGLLHTEGFAQVIRGRNDQAVNGHVFVLRKA